MMIEHELLSFMDAYSGYNQNPMYEPNEKHTSFITDRGLYCYKAMPFSLKNTGVTYQMLVNMLFKYLIGKTMESYVNDMLVKSRMTGDHIEHLGQIFKILRKCQMKLNSLKCAFGVGSEKFLSLMVNQRGIEANLKKINLEISLPKKPKEVMSLAGRVAALIRFMSQVTNHCAPFFDVLRGPKGSSGPTNVNKHSKL